MCIRDSAVRDYIIAHLPSDAEYRIDPLGSLIVYKKGKAEPKNKVMPVSYTHLSTDGKAEYSVNVKNGELSVKNSDD